MLFSEPKIPQSKETVRALLKHIPFQCSSASRKFLNGENYRILFDRSTRFSALQRAENSSIFRQRDTWALRSGSFSALQRAENSSIFTAYGYTGKRSRFSALQRAENSSIAGITFRDFAQKLFQCSSASRKFLNHRAPAADVVSASVSVLFSEPKIPQ